MSSIAKSITTIVCAIAATGALAQQQQPALNYDCGSEVALQLRHSWKNIGAKQVAAKAQQVQLGAKQGRARSMLTQTKPLGRS